MVKGGPKDQQAHTRTQAERSAATRDALLTAGRRLFAERGFAGTGREDIVAAAGVTRGALQHHFGDKTSLFEAVYETVEKELVDAIAVAALAAGEDPVAQLRAGCQAYLDAVLDPAVQRICSIDGPAVLATDVRQAISDRYALGLVRDSLDRAIREGLIAPAPAAAFARILLAGAVAAADYVATAADLRAAREEAGKTLDVFLDRLAIDRQG